MAHTPESIEDLLALKREKQTRTSTSSAVETSGPRGAPQPVGTVENKVSAPPSEKVPAVSSELQSLYRRALWLGGRGRTPLISFHSLFLAFFGERGEVADWVRATAAELDFELADLLRRWQSNKDGTFPTALSESDIRHGQVPPDLTVDLTPSARAIQGTVADMVGGGMAGQQHVLAAYLFEPPAGHLEDLEAWNLRRRAWAARYLVFLSRTYPGEASGWRARALQATPSVLSTLIERVTRLAATTAGQRGAAEVDAKTALLALLQLGRQMTGRTTDVWLAKELGPDVLSRLGVPTVVPPAISGVAEPPLTAELEGWLSQARICALASEDDEIHLRHFVAALLAPRGPSSAKRLLLEAGVAPSKLGQALEELIRETVESEDHGTWRWLRTHDVAPAVVRRPGYTNDAAEGVDLLAIERDVHALSAVLASRETTPPLSVGLFGDWGSGKSFFMRSMRDHIRRLGEQSLTARESAYCTATAQIEFNAWHYMDGDLWASLVSHILDQLERHFRGDAKSAEERQKQDLATKELQCAELDRREQELEEHERLLLQEIANYQPPADAIARRVADEAKQSIEHDPNVRAALNRVADELGVDRGLLTLDGARRLQGSILGALRAWWRYRATVRQLILGVLFGFALPAAVASVVAFWRSELAEYLAPALAIVPLGAVRQAIRLGRSAAEAARKAVEVGAGVERKLALADPAIAGRLALIQAQRKKNSALRQELLRDTERLRTALAESKRPTMRDYVLQRAASDDYRKRLGIIATVHRDLQNLSDQLRDQTTNPKLERIILYIDDLDRCPPTRVVEVLQAIHLILSFELFIVVVALDPSWLMRSLDAYYAQQFPKASTEGQSSPQFYLEKIFQIPYALRPMSEDLFGTMVDGLLRGLVVSANESVAAPTSETSAPTAATPDHTQGLGVSPPARPAGARDLKLTLDLNPQNLEITKDELEHLRSLGPLVPSPRSAKRLVNLYRIVRARLDGDALEEFVSSGYPLTQLLLAAVVGCPDLAKRWFSHVFGKAAGTSSEFLEFLQHNSVADPRADFLYKQLKPLDPAQDWRHAIELCRDAARYSFGTGTLLSKPRRLAEAPSQPLDASGLVGIPTLAPEPPTAS